MGGAEHSVCSILTPYYDKFIITIITIILLKLSSEPLREQRSTV